MHKENKTIRSFKRYFLYWRTLIESSTNPQDVFCLRNHETLLFLWSSCLWQLAPCCPVACEQVVMTCRGLSQAACLSLATGPYCLTAAPPATNQWGGAAAMNWKLHRWVKLIHLFATWACYRGWYDVVIFLFSLVLTQNISFSSLFFTQQSKVTALRGEWGEPFIWHVSSGGQS